MICLALIFPLTSSAQGDVVAEWNFEKNLPEGICDATNYEGKEADIPSTVDGIVMHVDATNGKLNCVGRNNAQFNNGTILRVPVKTAKDTVTVKGYPGYVNYTIGGVAATEDITAHRATSAEAAQGYVEIVSTGGSYIYGVKVVHVSLIQEKLLYSTDFSDWSKMSASKKETVVDQKTKYSKENFSFAIYNSDVNPAGQNSKFNNGEPLGWIMAAKAADPYILTSKLASVSKVRFVHAATGGNRGWKLEAKGDGDADWVVISDKIADPAAWSEVTADVNRTNVQLRWTNLNASQNAYMFQLDIFGMVDLSKSPTLGSFKVNGTTYQSADIFMEQADGTNTATIEISKSESMISETNPLTDISIDNGEMESVAYELAADGKSCVATIKVKAGEDVATYKATFVFKPDFTLTYYNVDGSKLGTQTIEKDSKIAEFAYDVKAVEPLLKEIEVFRGWFVSTKGGRKYTTDEVITGNISLYAIATENETENNENKRLYYNLGDIYFYPEDHEAFNLIGTGKFHDNQHGWTIDKGDKLELTVGGHAYIILGLCRYGNEGKVTISDNAGTALWSANLPAASDGETAAFEYDGEAATLVLTVDNGMYMHNITIINDKSRSITKNEQGYFIVNAGDADNFLATLEIANASASADARTYVFVPNGTYDLGDKCLTPISGKNISLIGQDMDKTIIMNTPTAEGIGITATILNTGENTYMQDITLKDNLDYYNSSTAGRGVALQDKGKRTICKNVKLLSYQDTYYSNAVSQFYWETSEIHGVVDYICGGGDVYFNKCLLVNESRKKDSKYGGVTITAPYTDAANTFGYVFEGCTVENLAADFNFGRSWGGVSRLAFLNTILNQPNEIVQSRFTTGGMNVAADKFKEYNSMDKNGNVVSPASNVLTFTKDNTKNTYETILTAAEAAGYALDKVFTDWTPDALAAQVTMPTVKKVATTVTWTAAEGAKAYAIFADGKLAAIVDGTATSYELAQEATTVEVRAANEMGGFGVAAVAGVGDGINEISSNANEKEVIYNMQGIRVNKATKGLYIINGKKVIK